MPSSRNASPRGSAAHDATETQSGLASKILKWKCEQARKLAP